MIAVLTMAPILPHFDRDRGVIIESDASHQVYAGVLSPHDDEGVLNPVEYFSKTYTPAECKYDIYVKEVRAII